MWRHTANITTANNWDRHEKQPKMETKKSIYVSMIFFLAGLPFYFNAVISHCPLLQ
jgi:hypothetical protein